jgi:hypothetical protein
MTSREQKLTNEQTIRGLGKIERMLGWVREGVEVTKWCSCEISIQWKRAVEKVRKGAGGTGEL